MKKKYVVTLTAEERRSLRALVSSGKGAARKLTHARILLKADSAAGAPNWNDARISEGLEVGHATVGRVRERFVEEGLEAALVRRKSPPPRPRKLDGEAEAHLIALACSEPPAGRTRWTMKLLAGRMVALEYVDTLSDETVRRTLKKTNSSPG